MEAAYKDYLNVMKELGRMLEQLTAIAERKMAAAQKDDLTKLDECIRQEQALSLNLRNIDRKREKALGALGLSEYSLSALPAHYPQDLRLEAKNTAEDVLRSYDAYVSASEAARITLECALHQIERLYRQAAPDSEASVPPESRKADIRA